MLTPLDFSVCAALNQKHSGFLADSRSWRQLLGSLFASLLLGAVTVNSLGAITPKTSGTNVEEFPFNTETFLYDKLPFGDADTVQRFMWEKVRYVGVTITDQAGNRDVSFPVDKYKFTQGGVETLNEFTLRASNIQLQHAISIGFPTNQTLFIEYYFMSGVANGINGQMDYEAQFATWPTSFIPKLKQDGLYTIDFLLLSYKPDLDGLEIPWTLVKRAALVVFNETGSVVYTGDTKYNDLNDHDLRIEENLGLRITKKFITNGYTGTLTVISSAGTAMYALRDGSFIPYPQTVSPLLGIKHSNGQISINVKGGAPLQNISLLFYSDLGLPPYEEVHTLDSIGLLTWTISGFSSPTVFVRTKYPTLLKTKNTTTLAHGNKR